MDMGYPVLVESNILFDGCSAGSCNFGDLAGGDERTSFYSTILNDEAEVPVLWPPDVKTRLSQLNQTQLRDKSFVQMRSQTLIRI